VSNKKKTDLSDSLLGAGVFYFCHGWSRIFTEEPERIDKNLWKSVQSVAENAVLYGQNDNRQTPVPTSEHSTWLFFVPSCLRGSFERIAAQNLYGGPVKEQGRWQNIARGGKIEGMNCSVRSVMPSSVAGSWSRGTRSSGLRRPARCMATRMSVARRSRMNDGAWAANPGGAIPSAVVTHSHCLPQPP